MKSETLSGKTLLDALLTRVMAAGLFIVAEPAQAAFPGKNGKIAFVSYRARASDGDIYAMNPDGTGKTRLTTTWERSMASDDAPS